MLFSLNWLPLGRRRPAMQEPPKAPPEPFYGEPRPITGFLGSLSPENQARLRESVEDENFGEPEFLRNRQPKPV